MECKSQTQTEMEDPSVESEIIDFYQKSARYQHRILIFLLFCLMAAFIFHFSQNWLVVRDGLVIENNHAVELNFKINPNTATWQQLAQLPGVGPQKATDIIIYREQNNQQGGKSAFSSPQDISNVKGIGPKTIEKISQYLIF